MYEYIEGKYKGLNRDYVIIDNNGIGYRVFTSGNSICSMPMLNENVKLYVEQIVRQDFIGLYGFIKEEELYMFLNLISINGVGAKAALSLLSVNTVDSLVNAVNYSDEDVLIKANGIGKKTAQRIILELKDKFKNYKFGDRCDEENISIVNNDSTYLEVIKALLSLGFEERDIKEIVKDNIRDFSGESLEFIIKESLKNLMR